MLLGHLGPISSISSINVEPIILIKTCNVEIRNMAASLVLLPNQ